MVIKCSVLQCKSRYIKGNGTKFHQFPIKDEARLSEWVRALQLPSFRPHHRSYLCSLHFLQSDYILSPTNPKPQLNPAAVPSVFSVASNAVRKVVRNRKHALPQVHMGPRGYVVDTPQQALKLDHCYIGTSPRTLKSPQVKSPQVKSPQAMMLLKKIKVLQQAVRRNNGKYKNASALRESGRRISLLKAKVSSLALESNFTGVAKDICKPEIVNHTRKPVFRRYSDETMKFAKALHLYSPSAYELVCSPLLLPPANLLSNCTSLADD